MKSRVVLINKRKTSIPRPQDVRPITVQNTILKLMELQVMEEIRQKAMETSEHQFGFKANKSYSHATVKVYEYLRSIKSVRNDKRESMGIMLIDFTKAYDRVDREILYKK